MNTISFSNAFKSLMATLGAKTTDSNYAVPLVNKTSGAPQGFMDMSSLASVLGEFLIRAKGLTSNTSLDDVTSYGIYYFEADASTIPEHPGGGQSLWCKVIMIGAGNDYEQIVFPNYCWSQKFFIRYRSVSQGWKEWIKYTGTAVS